MFPLIIPPTGVISAVAMTPIPTPAPVVTPTPTPTVSAGSSSSSLSDVPGVPAAFAACVAFRESDNGADQAFNGGVYGIITSSGIDVNGQPLAVQKQAFATLYAEFGTAPWAPSDGC